MALWTIDTDEIWPEYIPVEADEGDDVVIEIPDEIIARVRAARTEFHAANNLLGPYSEKLVRLWEQKQREKENSIWKKTVASR